MSKTLVDPEKIHLIGLRITKSYFEVDPSALEEPATIKEIKTGLKAEAGFNLKENYQLFRVFIKIHGYGEADNKLKVKGEYHIDLHFIIDNLDDFVTHEKGSEEFDVSMVLGATIAGISYSTCRGIILDRTLTTDFNGLILPVINPHKLLEEDTFTDL